MADSPAISVENVSKAFRIYHERSLSIKQSIVRAGRRSRFEEFQALQDVSFDVPHGASVGIVGRNGSGKSTLLKCVAGIFRPDSGQIRADGRLAALLELGAGFYPEYSGRENIYLNGALLGLSRKYIDHVYDEIVAFSELERYIDNTVKTYSSGMFARLGFSIAVHLDPQILVIDEILAVGDEAFQRRCYQRILDLQRAGTTMLFVSHSLDVVKRLCTDCLWLDQGQVRAFGPAAEVVQAYLADVSEVLGMVIHAESEGRFQIIERDRQEVGVSGVTVIGADGPSNELRSGESAEIRIAYYLDKPRKGLRIAANFVREDGVEVFWTSTDDRVMSEVELPTDGEVILRIPQLKLLQGSFQIGVSVSDVATDVAHLVLAQAFPVRVVSQQANGKGVVEMDHSWELRLPAARSLSA